MKCFLKFWIFGLSIFKSFSKYAQIAEINYLSFVIFETIDTTRENNDHLFGCGLVGHLKFARLVRVQLKHINFEEVFI